MKRLSVGDTLLLASANKGKIAELTAMLSTYGILLDSIAGYYPHELAEDGDTFEANALQKAQFCCSLTGLPALADDSGFCVRSLNDSPGIYSARWAGPQKDFACAIQRVHNEMPKNADLAAYFVCVLAICFPDGYKQCFRGEVHGAVCCPARGDQGFGYDPIFIPEGENRTFAEMSAPEKDAISHRSRAFAAFQQQILPKQD